MADSNEEEENQETIFQNFLNLNLPPPTPFSLIAIHNHLPKSDKPPIVFPPNDHENLHINNVILPSSSSRSDTSSPTSSSSFSPFDDNSSPNSPIKNLKNSDGIPNCGYWDFGLELLTTKVNGGLRFLKNLWVVRAMFLIFRSPVGPFLVLIYLLRWRRRRNVAVGLCDGSNEHLLRVIREKDERINELLNQIARMNEVLLSMHKVPLSKAG